MKKESWYQNQMRKSPRRTVDKVGTVDKVDKVDKTNIEIEITFRPFILIVVISAIVIIIFL